jgi:hypothetical protein
MAAIHPVSSSNNFNDGVFLAVVLIDIHAVD